MARSVFFSFHYRNDITRVMIVRNRWVTFGTQKISGIIDHADFEKIKRQGKQAISSWIDDQLLGTSATIVLIGAETLKRPYVQYEICQSINKGNAIIGVYINKLKDLSGLTSPACHYHTIEGYYSNNEPIYFDDIANGIYDYVSDDGYNNLDSWVDDALKNNI